MPYKDPERELAYRRRRYALGLSGHKRYAQEHKAEISAKKKIRYAQNRDTVLDKLLFRTYGITRVIYDAMLQAQQGGCAICGAIPSSTRRLAVDHCHATGAVRALLCEACNNLLGRARDNPAVLEKAIAYLRQHVY